MIARFKLPSGLASELELGAMTPASYALVLANSTSMWVSYAVYDDKKKVWSEWVEVYPTKIIAPLTPTVALKLHAQETERQEE